MEEKMDELLRYREELEGGEREMFEKLIDYANGRNRLTALESMLLSIAIKQQKRIENLQVHG
ncbi:hypothetical protein GF318_02625 [Candidatus Micrarchaeota archaeon]|nr:hypothetical protein [Candidatus Micrarchaeota archaeon]